MKYLRLGQEEYNSIENVKELLNTLMRTIRADEDRELWNLDTMKSIDYKSLSIALRYLKRNFGE